MRMVGKGEIFRVVPCGGLFDGWIGIAINDGGHWMPLGRQKGLGYESTVDAQVEILQPGDAISLIVGKCD